MASSSTTSRNWRYNVFPSFRGEDVRNSFLSHLLMELERNLITTFIDHGIDRSRSIAPELLLAIQESRIAIVIFSKNYASSTWCLNELVEIHKCFKDLDQMVIPIFYHVDPSEVRKQTGEFGERFKETCMGKTEGEREGWIRALTDVANLAGEDSKNWIVKGEAKMIQHIAKDVFNKLIIPSNDFSNIVGIEAHLERLYSLLRLESAQEVRKVGIWGPSGVGKSTIGRCLFSQLSSLFHHHAFVSYKSTNEWDNNSALKLCLDERLLSVISFQKDVKLPHLDVAKQRLMHKKVLIIVDDVDDVEALNTLTDQTSLVGSGSRLVVITQDKRLLESQEIGHIYEVKLPSYDLGMQMFCRYAFGENSPPCGFEELARKATSHSSNLPLCLEVFGSSLKGMTKEEWVKMMPRLLNRLNGKIKNTLKVCYDRLDVEEQELFLCIACLSFDGCNVKFLKDLLGDSAEIGLKILNDNSLIRGESTGTVRMHSLLQKLGKEINSADPINSRRFLTEAEDICDVLTDNSGTKNTLAMDLDMSDINKPLFVDENSFQGMRNLKFLNFTKSWCSRETGKGRLYLPDRGLRHFPSKLRWLRWDDYPSKSMPFNFSAECLVILKMEKSKLDNLWEGTQFLGSLKVMDVSYSENLKEIPDLSKAINVETINLQGCSSLVAIPSSIGNLNKLDDLDLSECSSLVTLPFSIGNLSELHELKLKGCSSLVALPSTIGNLSELYELELEGCSSLVTLPSSIGNLSKLLELDMSECSNLEFLPADVDFQSLLVLNLDGCSKLRTFPRISRNITFLGLKRTALKGEEDSSWIENFPHLEKLYLSDVPLSCMLPNFNTEDMQVLSSGRLKKLWGGVQSLGKLREMNLSCESLVEIPDLSMAIKLESLKLKNCKSLVMFPSSIRNLNQLQCLIMVGCTMLEVLPVDIDLGSLRLLDLSGCSKLRKFPQIATQIVYLYLDDTGIEEISSWIKNMSRLFELKMRRCKNLNNISAEIFKLERLKADFSDCGGITTICDHLPGRPHDDFFDTPSFRSFRSWKKPASFKFYNCFNLDRDAQEIITQLHSTGAVIPGGEVPMYFTHRACGSSLSILLSETSLSQESILLKICLVVGPSHEPAEDVTVRQSFRGQKKEVSCGVQVDAWTNEKDHLFLFILHLAIKRVDNSTSELNNNVLLLEFYSNHYDPYRVCSWSWGNYYSREPNSTPVEIKGCGARVMNISETDEEESDEESNRSKNIPTFQEHSNSLYIQPAVNPGQVVPNLDLSLGLAGAFCEERDEESNRSKKKMRMTVLTSQEHFNSLSIRTAVDSEPTAPNLELSLGLAEASSFDPCLGGESLHFEPMIIEQQNTGTSDEGPSFSQQLIDFFT